MVAILHCDWQLEVQISDLVGGGDVASYSEARRRHEWQGAGPHLAILVAEGRIRWLGRVVGGSVITTRDRRIHCSNISELETVPLELLREKLPKRFKGALDRDGQLPPATGNHVVNVLK